MRPPSLSPPSKLHYILSQNKKKAKKAAITRAAVTSDGDSDDDKPSYYEALTSVMSKKQSANPLLNRILQQETVSDDDEEEEEQEGGSEGGEEGESDDDDDEGEEEEVELTEEELKRLKEEHGDEYEIVSAGGSDSNDDEEDEEGEGESDDDEEEEEEEDPEDGGVDAHAHGTATDSDDSSDEEETTDTYRSHFDLHSMTDSDVQYIISRDSNIKYTKTGAEWTSEPSVSLKVLAHDVESVPAPTPLQETAHMKPKLLGALSHRESSELEQSVFPVMNNYQDMFFTCRSMENADELRSMAALHTINHCFKSREITLKHNFKIREAQRNKTPVPEYKDQGFTRPIVLVLLPFRSAALKFVHAMLDFLPKDIEVQNRKRFNKEFEEDVDSEDPDGGKDDDVKHTTEYKEVFDGNNDDCFKIGIAVSRKKVQLFSEFYHSDIIVASPLGLRLVVGGEGDKGRDTDFLSSIELLIVDQADVLQFQNIEHLKELLKSMNKIPSKNQGTDFSRAREWVLQGWSKYYRQSIIMSEHNDPELKSIFHKYCSNYAGRLQVTRAYDGHINDVLVPAKQIFRRIDVKSAESMADDRFEFFKETILGQLKSAAPGTLLFVPSYFDFVRIRNLLKSEIPEKFVACCEYTTPQNVSRYRSSFYHKRVNIMVVTGRCHFFRRYRMRGVQSVMFYALPEHPYFYSQVMNYMQDQGTAPASVALFTKYDAMPLERIVGSNRYKKMLSNQKDTFLFC
jgi:U3 small nucleolar RNA-associated protein 25